MTKEIVKKLINKHIYDYRSFIITKTDLYRDNIHLNYNFLVRANIAPRNYGVYIWRETATDKILYIGMAGKITQGVTNTIKKHDLRQRLMASRGKDKKGKDITTSDYLNFIMSKHHIGSITIEVFIANKKTAPSYIEAILLQKFWELTDFDHLPMLNKSF